MMRELVFITKGDWVNATNSVQLVVTPGAPATEDTAEVLEVKRGLSAKEKAQVGMLRRWTRILAGLPADEGEGGLLPAAARPGPEGVEQRAVENYERFHQLPPGSATLEQVKTSSAGVAGWARGPGSAEGQPAGPGKRKFKMSTVVDQRDDQEAEALGAEAFRAAVKRFKDCNDGLNPAEDEEATPDQLQGIAVKLAQDVVPYADFGVLRPFGFRLEYALKFHAKFWDPVKAEFVARELPGPPSLQEWLRAWKVYTFILVALGAASRARLERYRDKVVALTAKYGTIRGESWWIIAVADQRMRSERMERIRRELEAAVAEGRTGDAMGFDPKAPWDAVFLKASTDSEYWQSEVVEVALLYASRVKEKEELVDPGHHVRVSGETGEEKGRGDGAAATLHNRPGRRERGRKAKQELEKSRAAADEKGQGKGGKGKSKGKKAQFCFAWNRDAAGCPNPCPNGRVHMCERCGSAEHKGKDCKP